MPQFFEHQVIGVASGQQTINTWWYMRENVANNLAPVAADLQALHDGWTQLLFDDFRGIHCADWSIVEQRTQGYDTNFVREPFLPLVVGRAHAGTAAGTSDPPYVAVILSFRIEPRQPSIVTVPPEPSRSIVTRRGYLSVGPPPSGVVSAGGGVAWGGALTSSNNVRDKSIQSIAHPDAAIGTTDFIPIRVSAYSKWHDQRGYGRVMSAVWRSYGSTRRSRILGKGV